jgi:hypothetical protein
LSFRGTIAICIIIRVLLLFISSKENTSAFCIGINHTRVHREDTVVVGGGSGGMTCLVVDHRVCRIRRVTAVLSNGIGVCVSLSKSGL